MGISSRFVRRFAGHRWFAALARRVAPPLDRLAHRMSGGRRLATPASVPTLWLTTTGRHTGRPRTVALCFAVEDGVPVVAGTNWGRPRHPAWSWNLLSEPRATVEHQGRRWEVRATPVPAHEHDAAWALLDAVLPAFRAYRSRLERPTRLFRLERA